MPFQPADSDKLDPKCNHHRSRGSGYNKRCGDEPSTAYRIPSLGLVVYVCEKHEDDVKAIHPNAEEIGL